MQKKVVIEDFCYFKLKKHLSTFGIFKKNRKKAKKIILLPCVQINILRTIFFRFLFLDSIFILRTQLTDKAFF